MSTIDDLDIISIHEMAQQELTKHFRQRRESRRQIKRKPKPGRRSPLTLIDILIAELTLEQKKRLMEELK